MTSQTSWAINFQGLAKLELESACYEPKDCAEGYISLSSGTSRALWPFGDARLSVVLRKYPQTAFHEATPSPRRALQAKPNETRHWCNLLPWDIIAGKKKKMVILKKIETAVRWNVFIHVWNVKNECQDLYLKLVEVSMQAFRGTRDLEYDNLPAARCVKLHWIRPGSVSISIRNGLRFWTKLKSKLIIFNKYLV